LIPPGKPTSELSKASIGVGVYAEKQVRGIGKRLEYQKMTPEWEERQLAHRALSQVSEE
jgi:hypothetical protein